LIPQELPEYVERGGRQVWRPPYTARGAEVFGFVLKARRPAIDDLLQRDFAEPSRGAVEYRCAHDHIMVTFVTIDRLASGEPPDSLRGYLPEKEVSVWCLAAEVGAASRLVWYLPYVFTDSGQTVATGREVYGYPKQIGFFADDFPNALATGGTTTVRAPAIDAFGPNVPAVVRPMIRAERLAPPGHPEEHVPIGATRLEEFILAFGEDVEPTPGLASGPAAQPSAAITPANAPPPPGPPPSPAWARRVLNAVQGRLLTGNSIDLIIDMVMNPTLIFLKQFRDVSCPTKACYQAVVEAPLYVHPLGASYHALNPDLFEIFMAQWASHPIAADLGVEPGQALKPERVFRATLNFDIQLGQEVWRAT
jgi:hypothetical protein